MYKNKLTIFAIIIIVLIAMKSSMFVIASHVTRSNLEQSNIANTLLQEHLVVASISYRLFKQMTDELIFDHDANQAEVRKKREMIESSIKTIKELEQKQRSALGENITRGNLEDTDGLKDLLDGIINDFNQLISDKDQGRSLQKKKFRELLEVTIDIQFRDFINIAVNRQRGVATYVNTKIETLNKSMFWISILLSLLSVPIVAFACFWLFGKIYNPLASLKYGANAISNGNYQYKINGEFDSEFNQIAASFNVMAGKLHLQRQQLIDSKDELEMEVKNQTKELTIANKLLQENDERIREFLADISHELRTPLTIIRGEAQINLRQRNLTPEDCATALGVILDQSISLTKLVDDLLLIARSQNGQLRVNKSKVDINPFLQQTVSQLSSLADTRNISIQSVIKESQSPAYFDRDRINQVLSILIDNAINYSNFGSIVTITYESSKEYTSIKVNNFGAMIEEEAIKRLFDRYYRASDARIHQGAGLGLAIAKSIIDAHNGNIWVRSDKESGTTFNIELPNNEIQ